MTISTFANPLLYDKIAQELNTQLAYLNFIDDLYPVCSIGVEEDETFPEVYNNDGTKVSVRALPDTSRAMSFFIITGNLEELSEFDFAVPMALIVWMNLQNVDSTKAYDFTAEKIRDVYNIVRDYGCYDVSIDTIDPFAEFSMLDNKAVNMRPHSVFRVNFVKNVGMCKVDYTSPILSSAIATGVNTIVLTYSESLDTGSTPATGDFSVIRDMTVSPVSNVSINGKTVVITLGEDIRPGDVVTLSYTAGTNPVQDSSGNNAANLSGQSVTNNVT